MGNDVPSGEELFDAIKCNIHGQVKGFYKKYKNEQVIDWTKCCSTQLYDQEGEELTYDSFKKMVDGKMNRYDLSHISQEIVNFLKARQEAKKGELDEQLREYINEWRKQRAKEEEELKRLKRLKKRENAWKRQKRRDKP